MLNGTMMQFFHWYTASDGSHWNELRQKAAELSQLGIDSALLPPAYKGTQSGQANGYDVYAIYALGHKGIQVYADIVLNHKSSTDEKECIKVRKPYPEKGVDA